MEKVEDKINKCKRTSLDHDLIMYTLFKNKNGSHCCLNFLCYDYLITALKLMLLSTPLKPLFTSLASFSFLISP